MGESRRILVCGLTGAGKTTVGRILAERLGLPFIDLDPLLWLPGNRQRSDEDFRAQIRAALDRCPQGWVVAGNLIRQSGGMVFAEADTVVWLRLPYVLTLWRLLRRTVRRIVTRERHAGSGDRTTIRREFFSRKSLLLYALTNRVAHAERVNAVLAALPRQPRVIVLRSRIEVADFLESVRKLDALQRRQ